MTATQYYGVWCIPTCSILKIPFQWSLDWEESLWEMDKLDPLKKKNIEQIASIQISIIQIWDTQGALQWGIN